MKKSFLISLITFGLFLIACSSSDDDIAKNDVAQQEIFDSHGIKPTNADLIDHVVNVVELDDYKLAYGRKNGHAWFAKYKRSGEEVYTFELASELIGNYAFSHCNHSSNLLINEGRLFLQCYLTNEEDPSSVTHHFGTSLILLDYETGKQLYGLKSKNPSSEFKNLTQIRDSYFIESADWIDGGTVFTYYALTRDGMLLWERDTRDGEQRGIEGYEPYCFLNSHAIMYCIGGTMGYYNNELEYYTGRKFSIRNLNLRDYEIDFEKMIDLAPETTDQNNIIFTNINIINEQDNIMKIIYKKKKTIYDQVSGNESYELLGDYYILLSEIDGKEIERGEV